MPADAELSFHGRILEGYRHILETFADLKDVKFSGFTASAAKVLQETDALVLPSLEEGSALVTYEAQGYGAVPLVSDATGTRCVHEESGQIHPMDDVNVLADHFRRLNDDRQLVKRLRDGVLAHRTDLTWDRAAQKLEPWDEAARRG